MSSQSLIRKPAVAGRFYPDDPPELRALAQACLSRSPEEAPSPKPEALGLMLPHAGYIFSGAVAGLTLGQAAPPQKAILLGPSHTGRGAALSVWPGGAWRTPLGDVPVDEGLCAELTAEGSPFSPDTQSHLADHALEVMLPLLQVYSPGISIVPVTVSEYNLEKLSQAGKILAGLAARRRAAGERLCLLASSDMNHFLPHAENMRKDALALDRLREFDPEGLFRTVAENGISMCGFAAVTLMLLACREMGARECRITAHTSSGVTGKPYGADMQRVVGYAGAIIPAP